MQTCRKNKASAIPPAADKQAKNQGPIEAAFDRFNKRLEATIDKQAKSQGPLEAAFDSYN